MLVHLLVHLSNFEKKGVLKNVKTERIRFNFNALKVFLIQFVNINLKPKSYVKNHFLHQI